MRTSPRSARTLLLVVLLLAGLSLALASAPLAAQTPAPAAADPSENPAAQGTPDPVARCWDAFEPAEWGKLADCLLGALQQQEAALKKALAQAATQAAQSMDRKSAELTLKESDTAWAAYRDAECARQLAFVAGRNHPDIGELTCKIRQTAQRIADLKFDE